MAQIFVSYARADQALVRPLVAALCAEGWSVWWDPSINTGEEFDRLITTELGAAKAVIVVWTPTSVESRWVRGEAREAATRGILIPVRFRDARLPLDVRSLHTTDLDAWHDDPQSAPFQELQRALRALLGEAAASRPTPSLPDGPGRVSAPSKRRTMKRVGAAGALVLVAALGFFTWTRVRFHSAPSSSPEAAVVRVGVLSFDVLSESPAANHFAGGLTDEIISTLSANQLQTVSREDSVALRSATRDATLERLGASLLFDGTVEENGDDIHVRVHLDSASTHAVVWSGDFTSNAHQARTLQTAVAAKCAGMIQMALFAKSNASAAIDDQTLALTLRVVDGLRYSNIRERQLGIQIAQRAEELVARAPDFAWGHSILSNALGFAGAVEGLTGADLQERQRRQRAEAERALALDPKDAMAYFALSALATSRQEFESVVLKGLSMDPHPAIFVGGLYGREGELLFATGRLRGALPFFRRAAALDPLSSWESRDLASALAALGQMPEAKETLDRCLALWPDDPDVRREYLSIMVFYGTPRQALAVLDDPAVRPADLTDDAIAAMKAFLEARIAATGPSKAKAVQAMRTALAADALSPDFAVPALAALGEVDTALTTATGFATGSPAFARTPEVLFIPAAAPLRADPRFIKLAAQAGAMAYWQSTGKWPDFCTDERLPYDCRVEAARAMAVVRKDEQ
jgi:adenylate cyclase